jgi:hypothetical protein
VESWQSGGGGGVCDVTEVTTPPKACVWDFLNDFPLVTQYRYRFTKILAVKQGLLAHPVDVPATLTISNSTFCMVLSVNKD